MRIAHPLKATLAQLQQVLSELSCSEYKDPLPVLSNSSIGQHTRHIIEFFQTLLNAYDAGFLNYDKRARSQRLEINREDALKELSLIQENIIKKDKEIILSGTYSIDTSEEITAKSTYHRELIYNLEHTIHHMAMIKIGILSSTSLIVPSEFGVASATVQYKNSVF